MLLADPDVYSFFVVLVYPGCLGRVVKASCLGSAVRHTINPAMGNRAGSNPAALNNSIFWYLFLSYGLRIEWMMMTGRPFFSFNGGFSAGSPNN